MALGPDHAEPAGSDHDLAVGPDLRLDFRADLGLLPLALGVRFERRELLDDPHVGIAAELDVGAPPGHVGGDGDRARLARLGDDIGLLLVIAGVEHAVLDLAFLEQSGEVLGLLDGDGAHQHRLPARVAFRDHVEDRRVLFDQRTVDLVVLVGPDAELVGRDFGDFQAVDLGELGRLGHRGAGHPGELRVKAEIVLEGDRGERLVLRLDLDAFLGFQGLVQPLGEAPPFHHPAGELVDDDDSAVLDDVVGVALEQGMRAQRLVDVVDQRDVGDVVEPGALEEVSLGQQGFHSLRARLGQRDGALLLVLLVVFRAEFGDQLVDPAIHVGRIVGRTGNDQRGPRLVDEDVVDLVHDREIEGPLDHLVHLELHVVAQIVEAELVVGPVGHVRGVGGLTLGIGEPVDDAADGEAQEFVDLPHPGGVAPGEVVVHRHHVDALARERVEIDRKGRDQRLALAGLHLRDHAAVKDHPAHELDVVMALPERALRRLAHGREGVVQQVVERLAARQTIAQPAGARLERIVGKGFDLRFQRIDRSGLARQTFHQALVGAAHQSLRDTAEHRDSSDQPVGCIGTGTLPEFSTDKETSERCQRSAGGGTNA